MTGSEGMLLSVVGEGSEDDLFDRDFDPDLHIESRDDLNSVPLNNLEFLNENVITPARATVSEPRMEKRPRLGPDWVRGIERSSQTLTIDDINCKLANAPDADDSVLSKLKSVAIKKRPQRSVSTLAITGEASAVVGLKHPNPGQILKAKVSYVESFGLFMQLPSPYGTGFVHNSQVSFNKDFNVKKMININQEFYVKVIKVFNSKQRNGSNDKVNVDLSIKYCEQLGGSDLDKDWEKYDKECGTKGDIKSVVRHDGRSAVSDFTTKSQSINSSSSFFPTARTEPTPLNDDYLHEVSSSNNRSNVASLAPAKLPNSNLLLPKSSTFSALSRLVSANRVKKGAGDNAPSSEFVRSAINIDNGVSGIANAAKNVLLKQDKIDVRPISTPSGSSLTPAQIHSNVLLPKSSTFSALSRLISANRVKKGAGDNKSSSDSIVAHNAVGTPSGFVNGSTTVSTSGAKSQPLLVAPSFISEVTTAGNYSREKLESNSLPRSQAEPSATMKNFILSRQAQKIASNVTAGDKSFNREDASSSDANKISTANSKCAEDFLNNISKSNFGMPPEVIHAVPSKRSHFQDPHPIIGSDRINPGNRGWKENDYISAEEGEIQDVFKSKSRDGRLPHEDQNSVALNKKMAACKHKMKKQKIVDSRKDDGTYKAGMYGPGGDRNDDTSTYRPEKYLH